MRCLGGTLKLAYKKSKRKKRETLAGVERMD